MSEREIFLAAREYPSVTERAAFLHQACSGNPELLDRMERLLRADEGIDSLLDVPPVTPTPTKGFPACETDNSAEEFLSYLQPASRSDSLGRLDHYELLEVLGKGGFGIVFRAFDETLHRVVAVKMLAPRLAVTSPARKRFLREARSSAAVRHDNIIQIYAIEEQPLPFLVMEYIPGETLQQRLDRTGPLEIREILVIGRQIAEGLAAAHAMGLVHRDIKPANVLIERGPVERVKLTDFGLARAADDASITQSGLVAGTPLYMSPEQARGEKLDHRSDLFSLGSVLYTMAVGHAPFRAANTLAVLKRVNEDNPRGIRELIPEIPIWLCSLIGKLHEKDPDNRLQSAKEVADLFSRYLMNWENHSSPDLARIGEDLRRDADNVVESSPPGLKVSPERPKETSDSGRMGRGFSWMLAATALLVFTTMGLTEATGVTKLRGTVVRLFTSTGTLVVESNDPNVSIRIDGEELSITGAGVKELRVKPGQYQIQATRAGKVIRRELVTITKNGKEVVRIHQEPSPVPKGDYALSFDGATSYVEIPSLSRDENTPLTIEAFVTVSGTNGAVLVRMEGKFDCQMYGWPGKQAATQWVPNGIDDLSTKMNAALTPALTPGRRAHVAFQMDDKSLQLFIEGRRVNSIARRPGKSNNPRRGTWIGAEMKPALGAVFSGKIDEVRISKTLRYDSDFTPAKRHLPDRHTLALYHCDEGTGDKLTDASGNGHHGKLIGAKWVKSE